MIKIVCSFLSRKWTHFGMKKNGYGKARWTSMSSAGTGSRKIHQFLVAANQSSAGRASRGYLRDKRSVVMDANSDDSFSLTAPLGDQRIDVHKQGQQLVRLIKAWFVAVKGYHDGALNKNKIFNIRSIPQDIRFILLWCASRSNELRFLFFFCIFIF